MKHVLGANIGVFNPSEYISSALSGEFPLDYALVWHSPDFAILGVNQDNGKPSWNLLINENGSNDRWSLVVVLSLAALRQWLAYQSDIVGGLTMADITTSCVRYAQSVKYGTRTTDPLAAPVSNGYSDSPGEF